MRRPFFLGLVIGIVGGLSTSAALALDMPARKAGLWQMKMTFAQPALRAQVIRQCIDAATDKLMNANFGGVAQQSCSKQDMHKSGDTIVVDSVCSFSGRTTQTHAVVTGSFDSAYKVDVTTKHVSGPPLPGAPPGGINRMMIEATRLGDCTKGQHPGDIIMGNGMTMNVLELQKLQKMRHLPPPQR